jgi:hypothetical protein
MVPTLVLSMIGMVLSDDGTMWTVHGQLGATAVVLSGPTQTRIGEPMSLRLVMTGPPEMEIAEPVFATSVADGTLVGMSSFGPDQTGPFVSRGWVMLIKPQERGGLSLPDVDLKTSGESSPAHEVRLSIPMIEVVDSVEGEWESVGTFFVWAGMAGLLVVLVGGALALGRSGRSEVTS